MVSSGGGGSSKVPNQPTPSGQITGYGAATPADPQFNSVLTNGMGWADVGEIDAANDANAAQATQRAQQAAAGRAQLAQQMGPTGTDAFAQKLLDYQKQGRIRGMAYAAPQMFGSNPAPTPSNPTEQLMMQALQSRGGGSGMAGNGRSMASYRR